MINVKQTLGWLHQSFGPSKFQIFSENGPNGQTVESWDKKESAKHSLRAFNNQLADI